MKPCIFCGGRMEKSFNEQDETVWACSNCGADEPYFNIPNARARARSKNLKFQILCGVTMGLFIILYAIFDNYVPGIGFIFFVGLFLGSKITIDIFRDSEVNPE